MSKQITAFFEAWQLTADDARLEKIVSAVTTDIEYSDPRAPETIQGVDALVSM